MEFLTNSAVFMTDNGLLYYSEDSPSGLRWAVNRHGTKGTDSVAGCLEKDPRTGRQVYRVPYKGRLQLCHRVIYEIFHGNFDNDMQIDHIDGNPLNNIIFNLRLVDSTTNRYNYKKRSDNKTGVTGVVLKLNKPDNYFYTAHWIENGISRSKSFSHKKYGTELAFKLAVDYREHMIATLKEGGQDITERHGK